MLKDPNVERYVADAISPLIKQIKALKNEIKALKQVKNLNIPAVIHSPVNLEEFLRENEFELNTYYETNKSYRKEITECQTLFVRIYSDVNKIVSVEYENRALTQFEDSGIVSLETIETIEQLMHLMKAL